VTRKFLILLSLVFFINCSADKKTDSNNNAKSSYIVTTIIARADITRLQKMISNPCDTFSYEFSGLYPILDTLPNAFSDSLIMDNYLKSLGFKVSSTGHGNWENGPRVVTLELTKGNCNCKVYKKYYYNDSLPDGTYNLRVTEKVVCNADNNAVE
jgi:hypothetical protein